MKFYFLLVVLICLAISDSSRAAEAEPPLQETGRAKDFEAVLTVGVDRRGRTQSPIQEAYPGEYVIVHFTIKNPSIDRAGLSGVLLDAIARRPDGSILEEDRDGALWVRRVPAARDEELDGDCHFSFQIEEGGALGLYPIDFVIKDIPGQLKIHLKTVVRVVEKPLEKR